MERIGKGKVRQPYESGVKVGIAIGTHCGLMVGARSFTGTPYDGHTLGEQIEHSGILLQYVDAKPHTVYGDLGSRGDDRRSPLIDRGKYKTLTDEERKSLKWRQAVEPVIGHLKQDHRMRTCWLKSSEGDALNAVFRAAGYNVRWMLRAIVAPGLGQLFASFADRVLGALESTEEPERRKSVVAVV